MLDPQADDFRPSPPGATHVLAPLDDPEGTRTLAARAMAISFENEWLILIFFAALEADASPPCPGLRPTGRWSRSVSKRSMA